MKAAISARLGLSIALLFVSTGTLAQKVTTQFNKNFDFANHKRYAWDKNHLVTRQSPENQALIDQKIVQDVDRDLAGKGFVLDPANPDFLISYEAGAADSMTAVEGFQSGAPPRVTDPQGPVYGIPQNVWYSVDGQITFHVADAKSKQPVWTATAQKKIRDPHKAMKDMEKQVEQIVSKTFKSFPPRAS